MGSSKRRTELIIIHGLSPSLSYLDLSRIRLIYEKGDDGGGGRYLSVASGLKLIRFRSKAEDGVHHHHHHG